MARGFRTPALPGQHVIKRGVYTYRCPICHKSERHDDAFGPACTGPSWTDDHPMAPMELVGRG